MKNNSLQRLPVGTYRPFLSWLFPHLESMSYLESCWLHGSRVEKTHNRYSDLDIGFIVKDDRGKKKLNKLLRHKLSHRAFYDYFNDRVFDYWTFRGKEVGLHLFTKKEFASKVNSFKRDFNSFDREHGPVQHVILNSLVFYDKNSFFSSQKKKCRVFIEDNRQAFIKKYLCRLKQEAEWWEIRGRWKNIFEEIKQIYQFVTEAAKCQYLLNGGLSVVPLKQYDVALNELMPRISNEIIGLVSFDPKSLDCKRKIRLMKVIYRKMSIYSKIK